jgi:hypothetical protein
MLDLEAAAMLMTAFQHKAAAAANGTLHNGEGSSSEYSPDRSSILRPSDYISLRGKKSTKVFISS